MRSVLVSLSTLILLGPNVEATTLFFGSESADASRWGRVPALVGDLQDVIDGATDGDTIRIGPGLFEASPRPYLDPLCGNCLEHRTEVTASIGYSVEGKSLHLIGAGPEATVLSTHAGYGLYFEDSYGSTVRDLAVTGGRRDPDGNATDAAIVARRSRLRLEKLHLRDNTDRSEGVVVGIGGVMGREGSDIEVLSCRILNNGWDGVALYRGATARIVDNVIEIGRGAGIGVTWDAVAVVLRNRVSRYWKGIGTFGVSRAVVRNNAVFDNLGWGIIATGDSFLEATHNVIVRNGNCGFAVWSSTARGVASNNIIAENGWRKEWVCPRVGLWHQGEEEEFRTTFNLFHRNAEGDWISDLGEPFPESNRRGDPLFVGPDDFRVLEGSPTVDTGDAARSDLDGSHSDVGLLGGPSAQSEVASPPEPLEAERFRIASEAWRVVHQDRSNMQREGKR